MIYAVNKRTKEHILHGSQSLDDVARCPGWDYIQADADGWVEWTGGNQPLPREHKVECRIVGGEYTKGRSCEMPWSSCSPVYRVTAYRPIIDQPASEEPKGWDGEGLPPVGTPLEGEHADYGWIKGRFMFHDEGERVVVLKTEHGYLGFGVYRTIPTPRERWVDKAALAMGAKRPQNANHLGLIYDALASGELPTPEKTQ